MIRQPGDTLHEVVVYRQSLRGVLQEVVHLILRHRPAHTHRDLGVLHAKLPHALLQHLPFQDGEVAVLGAIEIIAPEGGKHRHHGKRVREVIVPGDLSTYRRLATEKVLLARPCQDCRTMGLAHQRGDIAPLHVLDPEYLKVLRRDPQLMVTPGRQARRIPAHGE